MVTNPKITIGIPAYKEKLLSSSIQNILDQTFTDFELIILNDNPGSRIKEIVNNFDDDRIIYYENEKNIGGENIILCWNKLLEYAKGEYFVLFSDDDLYEKEFISELHNLFLKYPKVAIVHSRVKIINDENEVLYVSSNLPEYESCADFIWHRIKSYRFNYASDFMVKTNSLKEIGGFIDLPRAWGSDDLTWFSLANIGGIAATSKLLCGWRESTENISKVGSIEERFIAIDSYFIWLNDFVSKMNVSGDDFILVREIKKNYNTRRIFVEGHTLKQAGGTGSFGIVNIIFTWLKIRIKRSISIQTLIWAILLQVKESKKVNKS